MTWKLLIWIAGLFVAALSWALFLIKVGWLDPEERGNLLVDVIYIAAIPLIWPGIVGGIAFAIMKFRKEKAVTALWIATGLFLLSAFVMLNKN